MDYIHPGFAIGVASVLWAIVIFGYLYRFNLKFRGKVDDFFAMRRHNRRERKRRLEHEVHVKRLRAQLQEEVQQNVSIYKPSAPRHSSAIQ